MPGKAVFISYSHDSEEHREKVLALAERLREDGLDARLDQYVEGTPEQGWPRWMLDQLDEAKFVLVVCTETYYRRFRGHEVPGRGKGADWEGALITQEIYDSRSRTVKFVPVMIAAGQERFIP
ncbi:MAG TPA: SEFIR domain-containing protein, partial [Thermoanaerobaculia bacterium]|nr:SEFIR domain-containing protein [Thermoanaerobaculia bacterium]